MDFNMIFWGARLWIWLYLLLSVVLFLVVVIYFYREIIRKKYYEIRFPEKLLKVVIHYKNQYFKEFWRLIPDDKYFSIQGKHYSYDDKNILKDNQFFVRNNKTDEVVVIDGKEYTVKDMYKITKRGKRYPEVHYFYNVPLPIEFNITKKGLSLSAKQLETFKENDLFGKLLSLETEKKLLTILFMLSIINFLATLFIIAKMMGWLEPK